MVLFGSNPGVQEWALERQGLPSIKVAVQGQREVVTTNFQAVRDYAAKMELTMPDGKDYFEWQKEVLDSINTEDHLKVFHSVGGIFHKHLLDPGMVLFVPFGFFVKERILGTTTALGYRASALDPTPENIATFEEMHAQHRIALGPSAEENVLVKFWTEVISVFKTGKA